MSHRGNNSSDNTSAYYKFHSGHQKLLLKEVHSLKFYIANKTPFSTNLRFLAKKIQKNDKSVTDQWFILKGGVKGNGKHSEDQTSCY